MLIPPVSAHVDDIGSENKTRKTSIEIDAISLPHIISRGESRVVKREAKVLFSRSKVMEEAENAGTNRINNVRLVLKNNAKRFRPLADATE